MSRLFAPRTIAFVGGTVAAMSIRRTVELGFEGEIWPVNPSLDEIEGFPCFDSIADLPDVPDAVFIGVRSELTVALVRALSEMGVGGCVCYAAGFAEIGGAGASMQEALVEAAGGMPLIGPNCFGFINYIHRCALWPYIFDGHPPESGAALISQSGNIAMNLTMNQRSVRFTHVIGAGNQAVVGAGEYVDALLDDNRVTAIGMYIEGFDDVDRFAVAAERAADKGVPLVVMKVGRTDAGAQQTSSHTSSLAGSDRLYDAFFHRLGIVRVNSFNQLLETLKVFDCGGALTGRKIVTLSCSGGEAAVIADAAPVAGLETTPFSDAQVKDLESQFPEWVTVSNPFDYNTSIWGIPRAMERCFLSTLQGDHDAAFLVYDYPTVDSAEADEWLDTLDAFIAAHEATGKPAFVICTITELLPQAVRDRMLKKGVVPLQGLEDGLAAYAFAVQYFEHQRDRLPTMTLPRVAGTTPTGKVRTFDESQSKQSLAAFGVPIPAGEVGCADDLPAIADRLGYPVVVKATGAEFLHKTELGAVAVNIGDHDAVVSAVDQIASSCDSRGVKAEQFLVEHMVSGAVAELIIGIKRDEQFGPALVIGSGGVLVELVADSTSLLLPVTRDELREAVDSLMVAKLLHGFRGRPRGDMDALLDAIEAVVAFAEDCWSELLELDVNPLMVLPEGQGVVAADALIVLQDEN